MDPRHAWLADPLVGGRTMYALHWAAVHLRAITGERRSIPAILGECEEIDAVLNELLRGRRGVDDLCALIGWRADNFAGFYRARSTWLWSAYEPRVSVAMLHATRAFLKGILLQPEPHRYPRLSHWFDAFEIVPVDMLRYGPIWAARFLDSSAFTVPPIVYAAEVFKASLRDDPPFPPGVRRA